MIKPIISNRLDNKSVFIHCECGNEIIQFYYYKETTTCPEIIGLQYYGYVKNKEDSRCTNFQFNKKTFKIFINKLKESLKEDKFHAIFEDHDEYLVIDKDNYGFWKILKYKGAKRIFHKLSVWDISLRELSIRELIKELEEIWKIISEENNIC